MSVSFFDLMKYASTGIASPSMTAYDKMRALAAFGGGKTQTLTGVPPLSFKADGTPLISWSMLGNGQQTGTPTPDVPIMPDFCGVRTGNLFPLDATKLHVGRIENDGTIDYEVGTITVGTNSVTYQTNTIWRGFYTDYIQADENITLTFSPNYSSRIAWACSCYDENGNFLGKATARETASIKTFTTLASTKKVRLNVTGGATEYAITNPMLNTGSAALPYEPYGWKIPITNAGQTTPVYLGEVPTVRRVKKLVLTGEETLTSGSVIGQIRTQLTEAIDSLGLCTHYILKTSYGGAFPYIRIRSNTLWFEISPDGYETKEEALADFKSYLAAQYAAGTPVTVWYVLATPTTGIVNEPLAKIGDYADELHSEDAGVSIPTAKGQNTLTVDMELQPSEMTITGNIKKCDNS